MLYVTLKGTMIIVCVRIIVFVIAFNLLYKFLYLDYVMIVLTYAACIICGLCLLSVQD